MDIHKQLEHINKSLAWIENHDLENSENSEQKYLELVELRRKLRTIGRVWKEKPAVAVLSETQKGKSYLVEKFLTPFTFRVKDEKGDWVDWWERVSPIGAGMESTNIAIRFTSCNRVGKNAAHPVALKLFSVADLATILCECYHSCLIDSKFYSEDEIREVANRIFERYSKNAENNQDILVADDILDIRSYLGKYVAKTHYLLSSCYFERLALVIRRVPQSEWSSVLKYLWHENETITTLFLRLVDALRRLEFANEVYVDIDSVLHCGCGNTKNTILSPFCLEGFDDARPQSKTHLYLLKDGNLTLVSDFLKSELSAITMEAVFKIELEYLEDEDDYAFYGFGDMPGQMSSQTKMKLSHKVRRKDLWAYADLIDMPNVRERLVMEEDRPSEVLRMLIREKATHYFNINNEVHVFDSLLFCNDNAQSSFGEMYKMINDWVEINIGANIMARKQTICRFGGVSPLFVISTRFNSDMVEEIRDNGHDWENAELEFRWNRRFKNALYEGSLKGDLVDWFRNWDAEGSTFKNTYLLRTINNFNNSRRYCVFAGNNRKDSSPVEEELVLTPDFYNRLRNSFIVNREVQMFFEDPAKSWDVAATMNNDGSLFIIQNLVVLAKNFEEVRNEHFNKKLDKIQERYYEIMP